MTRGRPTPGDPRTNPSLSRTPTLAPLPTFFPRIGGTQKSARRVPTPARRSGGAQPKVGAEARKNQNPGWLGQGLWGWGCLDIWSEVYV